MKYKLKLLLEFINDNHVWRSKGCGTKGIRNVEDVSADQIEKNLNTNDFEICSGPLHIISFLPKGMNKNESDEWTLKKRISLMDNNFMLSRPVFKNRYFLRAVLGNYNTDETHILELLKLLD